MDLAGFSCGYEGKSVIIAYRRCVFLAGKLVCDGFGYSNPVGLGVFEENKKFMHYLLFGVVFSRLVDKS